MHLNVCVVARGLRAIGAVLRTAAGFNRKKCANLHFGRMVIGPVYGRRPVNKFQKWQFIYFLYFFFSPVVADHYPDFSVGQIINGN
jgi:hypothetical protein